MKFYSFAFGCRVNEAEKEALDRQLFNEGLIFDEKNPDIFIINTCSVTQKAEREARNLIYQTKRKLPNTKIVITGCAATYWQKNNLYKDLPIDLLIDNLNKEFLAKIIKKRLLDQSKFHLRGAIKGLAPIQNQPIFSKFLSSKRLMVKIQDGCQRFCSFCIVPYLRGLPKSYKIKDILKNIKKFENQTSEIILTAINTEAFGYDTGENFIDLIDEIIKKTSISRISFGSIHPWSLTPQFINFYQKILTDNRLVNFFHIPLQSGSNTILQLMRRGYKKEEIFEKLEKLQKINPYIFLATDVIVGFLEETDKEFEETYQFLEKSPLSRFHIFRFSKRQNTAAYYLAKKLKEPTETQKKQRASALKKLSDKKFYLFLEKNLKRKSTALILNKKDGDFYEALLDNQLPIFIPYKKNLQSGDIIDVISEKIFEGKLIGKII
ncbi:MAG: tRNA (N(6)-L-threonylcarbamoyladenosine(37)-C(2))-methylthiotransferase MtaB [Candidatus Microgenomates bacterium]